MAHDDENLDELRVDDAVWDVVKFIFVRAGRKGVEVFDIRALSWTRRW